MRLAKEVVYDGKKFSVTVSDSTLYVTLYPVYESPAEKVSVLIQRENDKLSHDFTYTKPRDGDLSEIVKRALGEFVIKAERDGWNVLSSYDSLSEVE